MLDGIRRRFGPKGEEKAPPKNIIEQVYDAPADFNRAMRRRVGMLSRIWRWDTPADTTVLPRYIRRHVRYSLEPGLMKVRRQRKVRARIGRIIATKGLS